jgi:hypothetical protein
MEFFSRFVRRARIVAADAATRSHRNVWMKTERLRHGLVWIRTPMAAL